MTSDSMIPTTEPPLCPDSDSEYFASTRVIPPNLAVYFNDYCPRELCAVVALVIATAISIALFLRRRKRHHLRVQPFKPSSSSSHGQPLLLSPTQSSDRVVAKTDFLARIGSNYGYIKSKKGFIDDWRPSEFPSLIPPVKLQRKQSTEQNQTDGYYCHSHGHEQHMDMNRHEATATEPEVYLDYAGSAIPTLTLLSRISQHAQQILANPHSQGGGLASDRTLKFMQITKDRVLQHFGVEHETFGVDELDNEGDNTNGREKVTMPCPGYRLVFTSGATDSLRLVAERFPWNCLKLTAAQTSQITMRQNVEGSDVSRGLKSIQARSILLYPRNVHTSVIGMRQVAIQRGAHFKCVSVDELLGATREWFQDMVMESMSMPFEHCKTKIHDDVKDADEEKKDEHGMHQVNELTEQHDNIKTIWVHHLLVLPLECNFGGDRFDWRNTAAAARESCCFSFDFHCSDENGQLATSIIKVCHKWHIIMDTAKAAATSSVNLPTLAGPDGLDFAVVSFYKMFGAPTGLGALFVKKNRRIKRQNAEESHSTEASYAANNHHFGDRIEVEQSILPRQFFGGGSVDVVLAEEDFMVSRNANRTTRINLGSNFYGDETIDLGVMVHGTEHFRGIASLAHGFEELEDLGGMEAIFLHSSCLAAELVRRLGKLVHDNGTPVVQLYGQWLNSCVNKSLDKGSGISGPTVAFNIFDRDGSPIGYDEVSRLATLNCPPIQLRTGCFCNPGACQDAIPLTNSEVLKNFTSGHVCGDRRGIVNGRLTGAIRASFGKDSLWEDMDALATFIEKVFVSQREPLVENSTLELGESTPDRNKTMRVDNIFVFPIKSCAAMRVKRWSINCRTGRLAFDREFALVDTSGAAMRLHTYPKMSQIESNIDLDTLILTVTAPNHEELILNLEESNLSSENFNSPEDVQVCGTLCKGNIWGGSKASRWFSSVLGVRCWLARHHDAGEAEHISDGIRQNAYCNEASLLLVSQQSVSYLNSVIATQGWGRLVETRHFRPNIVSSSTRNGATISGNQVDEKVSNPEDTWQQIIFRGKSGLVELSAVGKCARCQMVDIDPRSGMKGNTLRALAQYRRDRGTINFGTFFTGDKDASEEMAWLEEGDEIQASSFISTKSIS